MNLYALFYVRKVKDNLFPWDMGYGRNEEWVHMLNVFDSIERELDEWNSKKETKEKLEDSNKIPPRKGTIEAKIDALGKEQKDRKKKKKEGDIIQLEVPWKHAKQTIKNFKKAIGM